ncbi:hypothetical protein B0H15DRAFT_271421 [Mycena belliarum]|uniref:YEATS domain-containing protein n=1 Tax=Mycena belliarum TaxID=1033014 RepID=A0AAD6U3Y7_9AGAR|nr:hypothetical protein B0H15DRAFT_271421 [Mycena belliae]
MALRIITRQTPESESESEPDWDPEAQYAQDIASDIALEIRLRQRLANTLECRIEWALMLQQSLLNDASDTTEVSDFKDVALDALSAIDTPTEILFARDVPVPRLDTRRLSVAKKPRKKPTARAQLAKKGVKFLYIHREGSATPNILRCPVCMRTDFISLHGLFSHARGTHSLAWSSHDECVRHCACRLEDVQGGIIDFADLDAGVKVEMGGVLGLQSLFEKAVGVDEEQEGETTLSRTLGYHIDTPALATFLGREPIRRGVVVWDPDTVVDVDGFGDEKAHAKPPWRMPFSHRNVYKDIPSTTSTEVASAPGSHLSVLRPLLNAPGPANGLPASSRFHIVTRIVVMDRSLWIPPDQRLGSDTHKWMISVDAPSYTNHITTVLQSLTVIGPIGPLITAAPPFMVIGTAAVPFLARLELAFNPTNISGPPQKIVLEHWVELDRVQSMSVAVGEQQIVDIELDRGTLFRPAQAKYVPLTARALWDIDLEKERYTPVEDPTAATDVVMTKAPGRGPEKDERMTRNTLPKVKILGGWPNVLRKLVERFPLTLRDVKGGKQPSPALAYRLVATPAQFSSLVMGRKKAIEWGRAMAMRDAYSDAVLGGLTEDVTVLTTADIFAWLHENGYFPRGVETLKKEQDMQTLKTGFCRVCGLAYRLHAIVGDLPISVKAESRPNLLLTGVGDAFVCHITPMEWQMKRPPVIDISRLLPRRHYAPVPLTTSATMIPPNAHRDSPARVRDSDWHSRAPILLAISDPRMISAIRELVSALKLPSFLTPSTTPTTSLDLPRFPIDPALSPAEVRMDIAPYAMLSLLTKQFLRALVMTGVAAATRDRQRAMAQIDGRARRSANVAELFGGDERRMLTPSHILRGIASRGWDWNDELGMAMLGALARSGVPLQQPRVATENVSSTRSVAGA